MISSRRLFGMSKSLLVLISLVFAVSVSAQRYLPLEMYYTNSAYNQLKYHSDSTYFNSHISLKPILDSRFNEAEVYNDEGTYYYWITQKLFKEHFLVFEGEDFWCAVDPILDLEAGTNFSADSLSLLYWNTRGARVQAKFFNTVAFNTVVFENQIFVPEYEGNYYDAHGEFFSNPAATVYTQNNAVIPGFSRTKPFKTTGYDFNMAEGNLSWVPSQHLNIQLGNGKHFVGDGYRSLLLSDFAPNYPFVKFQTDLWKGRIQYTTINAIHQNLYRIPLHTTPEATYERKLGAYHYLDFAVNRSLNIGVFEGSLFQRVDSSGTQPLDPMFFNPVIGLNSAVKTQNFEFNSILGLNARLNLFGTFFYTQLVFDQGKVGGYQIGVRGADAILLGLSTQFEYNKVNSNTYLSEYNRMNYSHFNLPLAHPLTAGFQELVFRMNYSNGRWFINNHMVFNQRIAVDSINTGNDILMNQTSNNGSFATKNVFFNKLEVGYRFNKKYNLQAFAGMIHRREYGFNVQPETNYLYFGIRTRLQNKYRDF